MAYKYVSKKDGRDYWLHGKLVTMPGPRKQQIYYFACTVNVLYALSEIPKGFEITENARTGMPLLKKIVDLNL